MSSVVGRTWSALVLETDFCPRCQSAFCTRRNPKMISSCGHVCCYICSEGDANTRIVDCVVCKCLSTPKVNLTSISNNKVQIRCLPACALEVDRSRLIYELWCLACGRTAEKTVDAIAQPNKRNEMMEASTADVSVRLSVD